MLIDKYLYDYGEWRKGNPDNLPADDVERGKRGKTLDPRLWIAKEILEKNGLLYRGEGSYTGHRYKSLLRWLESKNERALLYCIDHSKRFFDAKAKGNWLWISIHEEETVIGVEDKIRRLTADTQRV